MVGEVAHPAGVLARAEVGRQVVGAHDGLGLEDDRRRGDPRDRAQRPGQLVDLGLVLAGRADPLPDERDGVEPEHLDAQVGQLEDDRGVLAEDRRVRPVDVPLVVVEGRPDPGVELVVPREVARSEVGEHLRQARLERVRNGAVGVHVEVRPLLDVARPCGRCPGVLARHVVEHQVQAQADALRPQRGGEVAQVVDGAEVGPHRAVVHHRVAAVVGGRPGGQQRHQVQVGDAEVAEVVRAGTHPGQGVGEAVGVGGVPEGAGLLEPVGLAEPALVELAQLVGSIGVGRPRDRLETVGDVGRGVGAPDTAERADQVLAHRGQARLEGGVGAVVGHASSSW